jgi:putative ABC transport system permease protein
MQDVRYALRSFRGQPIFTLVVVLTLTLGIGANTAIFSLLYQILLRPLPYPNADRLVFIWNTYPLMALPQAAVSIPDYIDRKTQAPGLEDAALMTGRSLNLAEGGRPEEVRALAVTPTFFTTLRRWPVLGRPFREEEAKLGNDKVAILTYGLWTSRFGGDRAMVGREIRLSGETYTVVGVLPADFELPSQNISVLVPFAFTPEQMSDQGRGNEFSQMIARLKPGATIEQVNTQMKAIVERNLQRLPERRAFAQTSGFGGYAVALRDQLVGDVRTPLYVLQAAVLVVLLIACANVANLLLMRATGRRREIAVRVAMGAGQGRLVRQLLTESIVLSIAGGVGGVALGFALVRLLLAITTQQQLSATANASLDPVVLLSTMALSVATGLAFGLVPALSAARGGAGTLLKDDSARASAGRGTSITRSTLVVTEMALALVLLVTAGLLIKSFARLQEVNPGFSPENVLTAQITLPDSRYADPTIRRTFWTRLIDNVQGIPGVTAAGLTTNVPFNGRISSGSYTIVGYTPGPTEAQPHGRQEMVGGDYFRAMHIPLVTGRPFDQTDSIDSLLSVIVDEYLVKRYFAGKNPIGQQIRRGTATFTVVGVVGTINSIDLGQPVMKERLYYPVTQRSAPSMAVVIKTRLDPRQLVGQLRGAVQSIDPEQPIADVRTLDEWVGRSLENRRLPMMLLVLFGSVALVLAAVGLYGVLAFGVTERRREFGIRQALGADARSILALVLTGGLRTSAIGITLGLAGSLVLTGFLSSQLYGVAPRDTGVFAGVTTTLLAVATAACVIPARRATRVDPAVTLRDS